MITPGAVGFNLSCSEVRHSGNDFIFINKQNDKVLKKVRVKIATAKAIIIVSNN